MLSQNLRSIRYAGIGLCLAIFLGLMVFPVLSGSAAGHSSSAGEEELAPAGRAPFAVRHFDRMSTIVSDCSPVGQVLREFKAPGDPLAPTANLCINGSLAGTDPTLNRPATQTTGTGIQAGCPLSGTIVAHDAYSFNITGCAVFPTEVTMTLCGPAGCLPTAGTDTQLFLYRNVAAGDPLTANGGLPAVFSPAAPCTNVRAANNELNGGASSTPGTGNTCNQTNTANCLGACSVTTVSGFRRQLGNGRFTLVVTGSGSADTGGYNLYVDAPAAGCVVALAPSAANGGISGRVITAGGRGIGKTTVTVSGGSLARPVNALTNAFGYYDLSGFEAGQTYTVSVTAKGVTFANPTRIVTVQDDLAGVDFVSID
jgi:hypothetical protein